MSFYEDRVCLEGLTFDDLLLIPSYSEIIPRDVNLSSRFTKNITLNVPFVSAAMDTVTEAQLAIAIAREGGIGVIHKNMTIQEQAKQVSYVKRAENGMINEPVTIHPQQCVGDALKLMSEFHIGGIPVVDEQNKLVRPIPCFFASRARCGTFGNRLLGGEKLSSNKMGNRKY